LTVVGQLDRAEIKKSAPRGNDSNSQVLRDATGEQIQAIEVTSAKGRGGQPRETGGTVMNEQTLSASDLGNRAIERRAIEAVNWGMPAVNYDRMLQAAIDSAKSAPNQIVYWSRLFDWKNQTLTPNPDVIYVMPFFNTKDAGPMVLEVPAASDDGSITGTVMDCWQAALEDVGPAGADKGKGGKYLILPPTYGGAAPDGYIALRSLNYQGYALLRSILKGGSEADLVRAIGYAKRIKFYPLSEARPGARAERANGLGGIGSREHKFRPRRRPFAAQLGAAVPKAATPFTGANCLVAWLRGANLIQFRFRALDRQISFPNAQRDSATGSASAVSWPPLVVVFGDMSALEAQTLDCTVLDKVGVGSDLHICGLSWLAVAEQVSYWLLTQFACTHVARVRYV
jgi:hypothetical protein